MGAGVVQWQYATFPRLRRGSDSLHPLIATLAQLVEQCFRKAEVPGSNPGGGSKNKKYV